MRKDIVGIGVCPNCGKILQVPLLCNVDLHHNFNLRYSPLVVLCSRCKAHTLMRFTTLHRVGNIQRILKNLKKEVE